MTNRFATPKDCPMCKIAAHPGTPEDKAVEFRSEIIAALSSMANEAEREEAINFCHKIHHWMMKKRRSKLVSLLAMQMVIDELNAMSLAAHQKGDEDES